MDVHCNISPLNPIVSSDIFPQRTSLPNLVNDSKVLRNNAFVPPHSPSLNNILKKISKGYVQFIKDVATSNHASTTHCSKLMVDGENSTLDNVVKRIHDVEGKMLKVKEDNKRLHALLSAKHTEICEDVKRPLLSKFDSKPCETQKNEKEMVCSVEVSRRFSLSLCQPSGEKDVLDVDKLHEKYHKLQNNLNSLQLALADKFESKLKYQELKEQLSCKEKKKEEIEIYNAELKERHNNLKQQIQILKDELAEDYPNAKLTHVNKRTSDPLLPLLKQNIFDSDEPDDCKFVTSCIKYVNEFNKQFQLQNFKMAAELAVNSPNGILRNYSTFLLFKDSEKEMVCSVSNTTMLSPIFVFCNALLNTSYPGGHVCDNLSREVIACAVSRNDADLTEHWLQSCVITVAKAIGDLLVGACECITKCSCRWTILALQVYSKLKHYKGILFCHLRFCNLKHVTKYMRKCEFSDGEFKQLISSYPDIQFSYLLSVPTDENRYITLPGVVSTFLNEGNNGSILKLLRDVYDNGLHGETLIHCLLKETVYDDMSEEDWEQVVDMCECSGDFDLAEDLCLCLLIRNCLNNATTFCLLDYIS